MGSLTCYMSVNYSKADMQHFTYLLLIVLKKYFISAIASF